MDDNTRDRIIELSRECSFTLRPPEIIFYAVRVYANKAPSWYASNEFVIEAANLLRGVFGEAPPAQMYQRAVACFTLSVPPEEVQKEDIIQCGGPVGGGPADWHRVSTKPFWGAIGYPDRWWVSLYTTGTGRTFQVGDRVTVWERDGEIPDGRVR